MEESDSWGQTALSYLGMNSGKEKMESPASITVQGSSKPKPRLDSASGSATGDVFAMKLSRINGSINKMTKEQLQAELSRVSLNSCGVKDVLKKRLKNYYKRQRTAQSNRALTEDEIVQFDYLVVIDFEATCSESNDNFVHEIIEFPAVLIDAREMVLGDVFQRFCKPVLNPRLTSFCTSLTSITQKQVDEAPFFPQVLTEFEEWLASHKLGTDYKFAVLTDGPWDMSRFLKTQTELCDLPFPKWARHWINLRKAYSAFYGVSKVNLQHMLQDLGMTFQGRPHCGLDDSRNIAAISVRLLLDGCVMRINEHHQNDQSNKSQGGVASTRGQHKSPPKSRLTQKHDQNDGGSGRQKERSSSRRGQLVDIPQEGENLEDLLHYLKLQRT